MAADMAVELREQNVACVSLWPGAVFTEQIKDLIFKPENEKVILGFDTKTTSTILLFTKNRYKTRRYKISNIIIRNLHRVCERHLCHNLVSFNFQKMR